MILSVKNIRQASKEIWYSYYNTLVNKSTFFRFFHDLSVFILGHILSL